MFQTGINALAIFTGAATTTMTCFVAGTMILTATGLVAIEKIQAGDIVISRNPETNETAEKIVVETYIREDRKLIHLVINGEKITTTETHPFYVNKKGFVEAGKLKPGEELVDVNNNIVKIEEYSVEITKEPTPVYNFQVEDFHTYFVGENEIWVHNAECTVEFSNKSGFDEKEFKRQLKDQQEGLGDLTIDEYKNNRQAYNDRKAKTGSGRDPNSNKYQRQAKKKAIADKTAEFRKQGYSKSEAESMAKSWAKGKAALHGPDQICGGRANNISGLGDSNINSSIGYQWRSRVGTLDSYINEKAITLPGSTKLSELDIEFVLK